MSTKIFLNAVRGFCILQFILVLLLVLNDGIEKSEMFLVAASAAFGLVFDGFSRTVIKANIVNAEKKKLDIEFDHLMDEADKDIEK